MGKVVGEEHAAAVGDADDFDAEHFLFFAFAGERAGDDAGDGGDFQVRFGERDGEYHEDFFVGNAPVDMELVDEFDGVADIGERDDGDVGEVDLHEPFEGREQGFARDAQPNLFAGFAFDAFGPFRAAGGFKARAGGGLEGVSYFLGREQLRHDAFFSLASKRARALTTPSMMASGRGGQPGTYMSTGIIWSTGPTRL